MGAGTTEELHRKKIREFLKNNSTKMILKYKESTKLENEPLRLAF